MSNDIFFEPMRSVQLAYKLNSNKLSADFIVVSPSYPGVEVTILQAIEHSSDSFRPIQTDTSSFNQIHSPEFTDTSLRAIIDRSEAIQNDVSYLNMTLVCTKFCCNTIMTICLISSFAALAYFLSTILSSLNTNAPKK